MQIFTWHDIERKINKAKWPKSWNRVDVYHDEVVINICPEIHDPEEDKQLFENIFEKFFDGESIENEFDHTKLTVLYEEGDQTDRFRRADAPLFKDISLENKAESKVPKLPGAPVMAFHSYKGGVGRTLSLIALAKGIAELYGDKKKVLIIDSDLEAPGLTWMINGGQEHAAISYLDVLSLMHFHDINTELAEKIAGLVRKSSLTISTEKLETEHYFLPVYREKEQLLDIFSSPEKIIANQNNKYIISEFLSMIGAALEADIVLVDLRAGVTESSAPFLFDPRVQKYFVTSTSMQSIKGTQMLLEEIQQKISGNLWESKILLTMIPPEMEENTIRQIEDELLETIEREIDSKDMTILREDYLVRVRFDSPFISLGDFSQICSMLKGKRLLDIMEENAESIFDNGQEADGAILPLREVRETLQCLHNLAAAEITAEGTRSMNMLATASIREIVKDYQDEVPQIAVLGEKGSGKTYLYKQMLAAKTWAGFQRNLKKEDVEESREALEERLELLWGKKLGKNHSREAASSRWIIVALSDFNRHLQARDIVRFLKFSTENLPGSASEYLDRFIVPAEIRQAIPKCSKEKLAEIKTEMKSIYQILERLMNMSEEEKRLPLLLDKINLTGEEISKLENQGYLISLDKKYYLPEIIRTAFGFRYEKGVRPRVLSLLKG
nr:hypothetical protein [uncultured Schaedlerella sp.]